MSLDYVLFEKLNALAGQNRISDLAFIFFAEYLVYIFAAIMILYWFINKDKLKARKATFLAFISFILAKFVFTDFVRYVYPVPRPFVASHVTQLIPKGNESSFPSGHAAAMSAIAMSVYFYNKKFAFWLFAAAVITGFCRVVAGVHYPIDIIGGFAVGMATSFAVEKITAAKLSGVTRMLSALSDKVLPFTKSK